MISTRKHLESLRAADLRALGIKDEADQRALALAIEAQRYRDEQHNKLREQIAEERGEYVSLGLYNQRHEALEHELKGLSERLTEFISAQTGRSLGTVDARAILFTLAGLLVGVGAILSPHL
jgi:preprotein translocase subunit SecF